MKECRIKKYVILNQRTIGAKWWLHYGAIYDKNKCSDAVNLIFLRHCDAIMFARLGYHILNH